MRYSICVSCCAGLIALSVAFFIDGVTSGKTVYTSVGTVCLALGVGFFMSGLETLSVKHANQLAQALKEKTGSVREL